VGGKYRNLLPLDCDELIFPLYATGNKGIISGAGKEQHEKKYGD
jgi:hypothetical protein